MENYDAVSGAFYYATRDAYTAEAQDTPSALAPAPAAAAAPAPAPAAARAPEATPAAARGVTPETTVYATDEAATAVFRAWRTGTEETKVYNAAFNAWRASHADARTEKAAFGTWKGARGQARPQASAAPPPARPRWLFRAAVVVAAALGGLAAQTPRGRAALVDARAFAEPHLADARAFADVHVFTDPRVDRLRARAAGLSASALELRRAYAGTRVVDVLAKITGVGAERLLALFPVAQRAEAPYEPVAVDDVAPAGDGLEASLLGVLSSNKAKAALAALLFLVPAARAAGNSNAAAAP